MDEQSEQTLARLIRQTRVAALGTLYEGGPNLAMVAYSFAEDFSAFYIHVSKLGKHTADMENDPLTCAVHGFGVGSLGWHDF